MPDHHPSDINPVSRDMEEDTELQSLPLDHHTNLKNGQNAHNSAGLAVSQQQDLIPTTGGRKVTTKWEYWTYCVFCEFASPNEGMNSPLGILC